MQEEGLVARARNRFKRTTMSDHDPPVAVCSDSTSPKKLARAVAARPKTRTTSRITAAQRRRHSTVGQISPAEFERRAATQAA